MVGPSIAPYGLGGPHKRGAQSVREAVLRSSRAGVGCGQFEEAKSEMSVNCLVSRSFR